MRIAYLNTYYRANHTGGGYVHMGQFVRNVVALGHEVWSYSHFNHPDVHKIPTSRISHIKAMRQMDALYIRIEGKFPEICTWSVPPRRILYGFPMVVWEFNSTPESELLRGRSQEDVDRTIQLFRRYARGCDLAICMTRSLAEYVQQNLHVERVLVVSNGSDPELFRPDVPVARRLIPFQDKFNVVWMGSGKESWHDFQLLSAAAQILWETERGKNINFHIIGPDFAGIMATMPPNIFYWGAEHYEKLPHWLAGMDVGLSLYCPGPADYATPLKVFDYMASGLAVVATPQPFMSEFLHQLGQADSLVDSRTPEQLAQILLGLASDRERVRQYGQAGREMVIRRYNWQQSVKDTMIEMETVLQERRNTGHK